MHTNKNIVLSQQYMCSFAIFPIQRDNLLYGPRALMKTDILTCKMQAQTNCTTHRVELSIDDAQIVPLKKGRVIILKYTCTQGLEIDCQTFRHELFLYIFGL